MSSLLAIGVSSSSPFFVVRRGLAFRKRFVLLVKCAALHRHRDCMGWCLHWLSCQTAESCASLSSLSHFAMENPREFLWYGNALSVPALLDPGCDVTHVATSHDEARVIGRIGYPKGFVKVSVVDTSGKEPVLTIKLRQEKVVFVGCAQHESDISMMFDLALGWPAIYCVIIAAQVLPKDFTTSESQIPDWSFVCKNVLWELLGSVFPVKTALIVLVRGEGKEVKVKDLVEKTVRNYIGAEKKYTPQPESPFSTMVKVDSSLSDQDEETLTTQQKRIRIASKELIETGTGDKPIYLASGGGEKTPNRCQLSPPLIRRRAVPVLLRTHGENYVLGANEMSAQLGWGGNVVNLHLLTDASKQVVLSNTVCKSLGSIMMDIARGILGSNLAIYRRKFAPGFSVVAVNVAKPLVAAGL